MTGTLLSFGHGYSARALARRLIPRGWHIVGTTRSPEKAQSLRAEGAEPLVWPGEDPRPALAQADHVLVSAGPGAAGDPVLFELREDLARAAGHLAWLGYLSTTSVYGDHGGAWVDEATPRAPTTARGRARAEAEAAWEALAAETGLPLHIFRLAGIYGPGRGPLAKVRRGTARRIAKPGQVFSRAHVEDIAQVLDASIQAPNPGAVYNVCDDDPVPPQDVIAHAAHLLDVPQPPEIPFEEAEISAMARSFYAESKRVANARIKSELGITLLYPTYREGLAALLATE